MRVDEDLALLLAADHGDVRGEIAVCMLMLTCAQLLEEVRAFAVEVEHFPHLVGQQVASPRRVASLHLKKLRSVRQRSLHWRSTLRRTLWNCEKSVGNVRLSCTTFGT